MKNVIGSLGCALLVVALAVTAFATQLDMTLSADKTIVKAGDVVTFTISMPALADCKSGGFNLDGLYDTEVFEFVGGDCLLEGTALENVGFVSGKLSGSFTYVDVSAVSGPVFTVQMKVKDTAPLGKTTVAPAVSIRNGAGAVAASINSLELDVVAVTMTLDADKTTAVRGDIVTLAIATDEMADCKSGGFNLDGLYDTEVFEFVGGDCPLVGTMLEKVGFTGGKLSGSFMYSAATKVSGTIFTVQMKVKDTAPFGKTTVAPTVSARNSAGVVTTVVNSLELEIVCAHDWGTGDVTTAATCTADGVRTYTCGICDETKTEVVAMLGHRMDDGTVTKEPTCEEEGTKTYACENGCGLTTFEVVAKLPHTENTQVTQEPTCVADGEQVTTCTECNAVIKTEAIAALGHSFTDYKSNGNATCTEDGTQTAKCDRCDETDTRTEEGSAKGHEYDAVVTAPTCTPEGYTTHTCHCGDTYTDSKVAALGHSFTEYKSNSNATCTEDGTETAKCDRCDETDTRTEEGSATGHSCTSGICSGCGMRIYIPGDLDENDGVDEDDVIYLLQHLLMPEEFPL